MRAVSLYINVINLYNTTIAKVCLTLNERVTITDPGYLFTFKPRAANDEVLIELVPTVVTDRYEQFEIDVDAVFSQCTTGLFQYEVREFEMPDPSLFGEMSRLDYLKAIAGRILETGLMQLHKDTAPDYIFYESPTKIIQPQWA